MRFYLLLLSVLVFGISNAQKATVSGVITDLSFNNEPLPAVSVTVKGTTAGTQADFDGKYSLNLDAGTHTLVFSFIGYQTVETPVTVKAGEKRTLNQALNSDGITIEGVVIEAVQSRERESALLVEQQRAVEIKQNIGAQELSRKGVGDVATAVAKTSGVSKQEGSGNVYVRGLGDRYNSTSINGLPVPSNDPEKKNIDLNLFSTDIVEYISIDKVYGSRISGDFAGGNVNIISKNYKGSGMLEISLGAVANTNAMEKADNFLLQDGPSKFGYSSYGIPNDPLNSFSFQNGLNPVGEMPFGGNFGIKAGKSFDIGQEGSLNLFATASFDNGFEYREGLNQVVDSHGDPRSFKSFNQEKFSYRTNTTGMFAANYRINENNKISYNLLFVNSSDQSRDSYYGFIRDLAEDGNGLIQRGTYIENRLMLNQLLGTHTFTEKTSLDWGVSYGKIEGDMPDRTQNTLRFSDVQDSYVFVQNTVTDNHRYYQNLTEDEVAANLAFNYKLGEEGEKGKLTVGYDGRFKQRDFEAVQFNFRIFSPASRAVNPNNLDAFFNTENYENGFFEITSFTGDTTPQTYNGDQTIHSGFASLEYRFTDRLSSIIGLRYENVEQKVIWRTQLDVSENGNTFQRNEFLPSVVLKYELNDKQNLRLGASKTYTLPQFKERALFIYEDVTETKFGNPYLYPSQDYNLDLKWELFPDDGEVLSVTGFGKYILDPINEVTIASSTNDISWVNIGDSGYVYGVELEARKNLFDWGGEDIDRLSAGLNVAYMQTYQDIDVEKVRTETQGRINLNLTDSNSGFTGASDLLINADVSYAKDWKSGAGMTATVAYAYFSDRLYALGEQAKGNLVDKATIGSLDFILKTKIDKNLGINFVAKNLLNPAFDRVQENSNGNVLVMSYKRGAFFSLGVNYTF